MSAVADVLACAVLWLVMYAALLGAVHLAIRVCNYIDSWVVERERRANDAREHERVIHEIDERAREAVADLTTAYHLAVAEVRSQRGRTR